MDDDQHKWPLMQLTPIGQVRSEIKTPTLNKISALEPEPQTQYLILHWISARIEKRDSTTRKK